jgi:endonuclease YncB( thermonuclease family)
MILLALLLSSVPIIAEGISFTCTPTRVWDGDGPMWCEEGPRLRLNGIAARETDGSCRKGHPCPTAPAEAATAALVQVLQPVQAHLLPSGHMSLAGAPSLSCVSGGSAGGTRTAARCWRPDKVEISCAMVATGTVLAWERFSKGVYRNCYVSTGRGED